LLYEYEAKHLLLPQLVKARFFDSPQNDIAAADKGFLSPVDER
jgi:hypothetical protein